jgi:signal transduction histidine kinase
MQMIQRNVKEGYDLTDEYLLSMSDAILTQIDKLNHIASTFSRLDSIPAPRLSVINAGDFLWDIYELYRDADEAEVVLELPKDNDPVLIQADVHQLNQVLVNIVKNALEAMERRGKIVISLSKDGINAIIKIADNGKGIPADIRDNLYEFRFTTKKTGSGVGLYLSRKMMLNMKGSIRFESQTGTGTTFYLTLPLAAPTIPVEEG